MRPTFTYEPASAEQIDEFLCLIRQDAPGYLDRLRPRPAAEIERFMAQEKDHELPIC